MSIESTGEIQRQNAGDSFEEVIRGGGFTNQELARAAIGDIMLDGLEAEQDVKSPYGSELMVSDAIERDIKMTIVGSDGTGTNAPKIG